MPVFQLIYRSKANSYFSDDDLIALLRQCRAKNVEQNVTGLLLYGHGSFIQLLEGSADTVRELYTHRIAHDPRHREPVILYQGQVPKRLFKDWSMAFRPLDAGRVSDLKGFVEPEQQSSDKNLLAPLRLLEVVQGFAMNMPKR